MKDSLGREISPIDGRPPAVPNLPVVIATPAGPKSGWMNGNTAVIADKGGSK
jgi:hypothetical protein